MIRFKAALLDLDGTLLDTEGQYTWFWGGILEEYIPEKAHLLPQMKGRTLRTIFDEMFPELRVAQRDIERRLVEFEMNMSFPFIPGAEEFVKDIKAHGVKCAVVTSSSEGKMANVLGKRGEFMSLFDEILTGNMFKASKPDPHCYNLGAQVLGFPKHECVVFEDAFTGLAAGMASGIYTVGLATENPRELIESRCNHVFDSFEGVSWESVEALLH
ncbi:MAG: HAD family hydrolase [Bacteroidales bacterium]|nr:HAD family hydrolase [Bacteroidales bacterium]